MKTKDEYKEMLKRQEKDKRVEILLDVLMFTFVLSWSIVLIYVITLM